MLQDLANLGELIGAVAVVVSLIYLAVQIRQNTRAVRSSTFQSVVDTLSTGVAEIARDPEITRLWITGLQNSDELSEIERGRFRLFVLMAVRKWENAFYQHGAGMLDEPQWKGIVQDIRSIVRQPGFRAWWDRVPDVVSSDFRSFIDELIEAAP